MRGHARAIPWLLLSLILALPAASPALAQESAYRTGMMHWGANTGGFGGWTLTGATLGEDGKPRLDHATAAVETDPYPTGGYHGRSFYTGGAYRVAEITSPELPSAFAFTEAIGSWNAETPYGTWTETLVRVWVTDHWSDWFNLGVWSSDSSTIERHSVRGQSTNDGRVSTDTLLLNRARGGATAVQMRVRLFSVGDAAPSVRAVALAYSTTPVKPAALAPGDPARWNRVLPVPGCSQMVYPDGGEVWCSPTSTAMTLAYWQGAYDACAPRVRSVVGGVYDWAFGGHGNWSFNTAHAATGGYEGYVARLESLAEAEAWIAAGVPVILSIAWGRGELANAPIASTSGHLLVLVGFDGQGNPIVNDPASPSNETVRRAYRRAQFESLWLEHSGGTVYLIYPQGHPGAVLN